MGNGSTFYLMTPAACVHGDWHLHTHTTHLLILVLTPLLMLDLHHSSPPLSLWPL